jgi:ribosomal protein L11 methylase PrmA
LLRAYVDGLPLDLAGSLLPFRSRFRFSLLTHIHLHAKSQAYFSGKIVNKSSHTMGRQAFMGLIDNLESAIEKLQWQPKSTAWADYYEATHYSPEAFAHKKQLAAEFLGRIHPKMVWDLGANLGLFSRIAGERGIQTIAFDSDPACVEKNYLECARKGETKVLPLWLDLTNPSPGLGWENEERNSLLERGPADAVLALALIHHLAISNNLPLHKIAGFFGKICLSLIIEFVPKSDLQVRRLLSMREDIFPDYTQEIFEKEFGKNFTLQCSVRIKDSERTLYLMEKK